MCHTVYRGIKCGHCKATKAPGEKTFQKCQRAFIQDKYPERCIPGEECEKTSSTYYKCFTCKVCRDEFFELWSQDLVVKVEVDSYEYWFETGGSATCNDPYLEL